MGIGSGGSGKPGRSGGSGGSGGMEGSGGSGGSGAPGGLDLAGRKSLVTGGGRGIGKAIALALAGAGSDVVVGYRQRADAASEVVDLVRSMGRRGKALQADVTRPEEAAALPARAAEALGGLNVVVCNAGIIRRTPFLEIPYEEWREVLATNLDGVFLVGQAAARVMVESGTRGAIVNVSSVAGLAPQLNSGHYSVSKAGVSMLTKQMALELAPMGIRVNEVNPGLIETDLNRADLARKEFREVRLSRIPLGIIGRPEDVAGAVVFLASDRAAMITGHGILIDGGNRVS